MIHKRISVSLSTQLGITYSVVAAVGKHCCSVLSSVRWPSTETDDFIQGVNIY